MIRTAAEDGGCDAGNYSDHVRVSVFPKIFHSRDDGRRSEGVKYKRERKREQNEKKK